MSTALDLDLAALVGELEELACESRNHETVHQPGPATHYARATCDNCGLNAIRAYCEWMVLYVRADRPVHCACGAIDSASEVITILGPVNGRAS